MQHSNCRTDFLNRRKANDEAHEAAHKSGRECPSCPNCPSFLSRARRITLSPLDAPPRRDLLTIHLPFDSTEPAPVTKRTVPGPRDGFTLENVKTEILTAVPYDIVREGIKY